jgi:hypothetical protein
VQTNHQFDDNATGFKQLSKRDLEDHYAEYFVVCVIHDLELVLFINEATQNLTRDKDAIIYIERIMNESFAI